MRPLQAGLSGRAPVARVFLDGSREPAEVRQKVNALLGPAVPDRGRTQPKRRGGLGKGLGDVITEDAGQPAPAHINTSPTSRLNAVSSALQYFGNKLRTRSTPSHSGNSLNHFFTG